jgi:hypothetical protein
VMRETFAFLWGDAKRHQLDMPADHCRWTTLRHVFRNWTAQTMASVHRKRRTFRRWKRRSVRCRVEKRGVRILLRDVRVRQLLMPSLRRWKWHAQQHRRCSWLCLSADSHYCSSLMYKTLQAWKVFTLKSMVHRYSRGVASTWRNVASRAEDSRKQESTRTSFLNRKSAKNSSAACCLLL